MNYLKVNDKVIYRLKIKGKGRKWLMYEYIKGIFQGINKDYIIVENSNIGYKIFTSGNTMASMVKKGEEVKIYTHQIVREDFIGLYGFLTKEELDMFNLLLTINGIGAKAALSLLSISTVDNLKYSIATSDEKSIVKAPGIGKKTAQRIILELKDKIDIKEMVENITIEGSMEEFIINESKERDAIEALMALGYTEKEGQKALKEIDKELSIEDIIKEALKKLMS